MSNKEARDKGLLVSTEAFKQRANRLLCPICGSIPREYDGDLSAHLCDNYGRDCCETSYVECRNCVYGSDPNDSEFQYCDHTLLDIFDRANILIKDNEILEQENARLRLENKNLKDYLAIEYDNNYK